MTTDENLRYREVELEFGRHLEDSEVAKLSHFFAAETYDKRNRWLGIPAMCAGILLTWLLTSPFEKLAISPGVASFLRDGLPIIMGLATSILTALGYFLNLADLASRHRTAAQKYQAVWRQCKNWRTDFPGPSEVDGARQVAQKLRDRLTEINSESPQIPKWAWKSIDRQRLDGSTSYKVELVGAPQRKPSEQEERLGRPASE